MHVNIFSQPIKSRYRVIITVSALLLFIFFKHDFGLASNLSDGFISQVILFKENKFDALQYELRYVHLIRYLIVYPFILRSKLNLPFYLDGLILIIYINLLSTKRFELLFCYAGLLLSFRSILCIFSLYYLWLYIFQRANNKLLLFIAFLNAVLSSGVLLNWVLIYTYAYVNKLIKKDPPAMASFIITTGVLLLLTSVIHKFNFFATLPHNNIASNASKIFLILFRSNLFDNGSAHGLLKNIFYWCYFIFALMLCFLNYKGHSKFKKIIIGLSMLNFLVEGLPALSYFLIYLECFLNSSHINRNLSFQTRSA